MGVRFAREYPEINADLRQALLQVGKVYEFFEMEESDWLSLDETEKTDCVGTLADDVFYGLGTDPRLQIGEGTVIYDKEHHVITVENAERTVFVVRLI